MLPRADTSQVLSLLAIPGTGTSPMGSRDTLVTVEPAPLLLVSQLRVLLGWVIPPPSCTQGHTDGRGSPCSRHGHARFRWHTQRGLYAHPRMQIHTKHGLHTHTHVSTPGRLPLHVHTHTQAQAACPAQPAGALLPLAGTGAPGRELAGKTPAALVPPSLRHTAPAEPPAPPRGTGTGSSSRDSPCRWCSLWHSCRYPQRCGVRGGFWTLGKNRAQAIAMGFQAWGEPWVGSAARPWEEPCPSE